MHNVIFIVNYICSKIIFNSLRSSCRASDINLSNLTGIYLKYYIRKRILYHIINHNIKVYVLYKRKNMGIIKHMIQIFERKMLT